MDTPKLVEDWFLIDDIEARFPGSDVAEGMRNASTHEEVEEIRAKGLRLLEQAW